MAWNYSNALLTNYANSLCSPPAVGGFSAAAFLDGGPFAAWKSIASASDDSSSGKMKDTFHRSPFGMMSVPLTDALGAEVLTFCLADSLARGSASPAMAPDWITTNPNFGTNKPESLASLKPPQSGLRTHQRLLFEEGYESLQTLPRWGMIVDGELYPLQMPSGLMASRALITSESGYGLPDRLPTPIAQDAKIGLPGRGTLARGGREKSLSVSVRVPTPVASRSGVDSTKEQRGSTTGKNLATTVRVPTPKSEDAQCAGGHRDKDDTLYGLICRPKVQRLPTPCALEVEKNLENWQAKRALPRSKKGGSHGPNLTTAVKLFPKRIPTPTTQDASNNGPASQQERNTKPLNAEVGGPLNPDWVEWLMGYPIGWTDSKPLATDRFRQWLNSHGES